MEFNYTYKIKASDMWQMYMYNIYSSYLCIFNVICMLSSVALLIALWSDSPDWVRFLLLVFLSLFTVIQPYGIYNRAKKAVAGIQDEIQLNFNESGIKVVLGNKSEFKPWKDVKRIAIYPTVIVIYTDNIHGYVIANRVLADSKKEFRSWIKTKRKK